MWRSFSNYYEDGQLIIVAKSKTALVVPPFAGEQPDAEVFRRLCIDAAPDQVRMVVVDAFKTKAQRLVWLSPIPYSSAGS